MRLSESEVVAGLQHQNLFVRDVVAEYLESSGRTQADITRHVIAAVERFGWDDALRFPHRVRSFDLDETTLSWALQQIERQDAGGPSGNTRWHLATMVANAPVEVLRPQLERILEFDVFQTQRSKASSRWRTNAELLKLRCNLGEKTPEQCWELLEDHCRAIADVEEFADADIDYVECLVERIASAGKELATRVLENLASNREPEQGYQEWLVGAMIQAAGRMKLESAARLIDDQFEVDWDWYNEEIMYALVRIGTPSVTAIVSDRYTGSPWYVRNYSQGILEHVHHDDSVTHILKVIPLEDDEGLRGQLGVALASHFDDRAIEPAIALYDEDLEDYERFPIIEQLFAHACLADLDLPRKDQWEQQIRENAERFDKDTLGFSEFWETLSYDEDGIEDRISGEDDVWSSGRSTSYAPFDDRAYLPKAQPIVHEAPRVGRNEKCPCGSGKKYKNCCLRSGPN